MPKKKKKKSWIKPKIDDRPCAACGEMIDMNGDGWVINGMGQTVHYGNFNKYKDLCFNKIIKKNHNKY